MKMFQKRLSVFVCAAWISVLSYPVVGQSSDAMSREDVIKMLREQRDQIVLLTLQYRYIDRTLYITDRKRRSYQVDLDSYGIGAEELLKRSKKGASAEAVESAERVLSDAKEFLAPKYDAFDAFVAMRVAAEDFDGIRTLYFDREKDACRLDSKDLRKTEEVLPDDNPFRDQFSMYQSKDTSDVAIDGRAINRKGSNIASSKWEGTVISSEFLSLTGCLPPEEIEIAEGFKSSMSGQDMVLHLTRGEASLEITLSGAHDYLVKEKERRFGDKILGHYVVEDFTSVDSTFIPSRSKDDFFDIEGNKTRQVVFELLDAKINLPQAEDTYDVSIVESTRVYDMDAGVVVRPALDLGPIGREIISGAVIQLKDGASAEAELTTDVEHAANRVERRATVKEIAEIPEIVASAHARTHGLEQEKAESSRRNWQFAITSGIGGLFILLGLGVYVVRRRKNG